MLTPSAHVTTFDLFSQVLNCAFRGQLTPAAIDVTLREFAIARGTEFTNGLTRVAEDFVHGLIDVVNGRSQPPPLASRASASPATAEGEGGRTVATPIEWASPTPELFARLTRLYFELLTRFTALQTTEIEGCLRALLDAADVGAGSGALALSGALGDIAASSLIVENSGSEPLVVGCLATAVRRADGVGPAFVPEIALTPLEYTLRPGEAIHVRTSLQLDASVYEPDVLYVGALRLMRQQSLHLEVPLHITATRSAR